MDREKIFDHFFAQYQHERSVSELVYNRCALWLTVNGLAASALVAIARGEPADRFYLNIGEPIASIVAVGVFVFLVWSFVSLGQAVFPRKYPRASLPHEIADFMSKYHQQLIKEGFPEEARADAESHTLYDRLSAKLSETTREIAESNEERMRKVVAAARSTLLAAAGLLLLFAGSVISAITQ